MITLFSSNLVLILRTSVIVLEPTSHTVDTELRKYGRIGQGPSLIEYFSGTRGVGTTSSSAPTNLVA